VDNARIRLKSLPCLPQALRIRWPFVGRLIGLDIGDKRVGVALSDASGLIASPVGTLDRAKGEAESRILEMIKERQIRTVVVGMPYSENGQTNEQCTRVESFCRRLRRRSGVDIEYIDEYLSTVEAKHRLMETQGAGRRLKAVGGVDAASACVILQMFLDAGSSRETMS
jgi:putative holliday junction resolvase